MATLVYMTIIHQIEEMRIASGMTMAAFSEYAGLPERYYAKALHPDTPSGRQASWESVQTMLETLAPHGFEVVIRRKPGAVIDPQNLKAKSLEIRALTDPRTMREKMREIGLKGASKGGRNRWRRLGAKARARIARKAAKARWKLAKQIAMRGREIEAGLPPEQGGLK
jgi:hypothetical protein